jgi:hypothetical protein
MHANKGLIAATEEIQPYRVTHGNVNFVLVDTPGFDDTNQSDTEILRKLLSWLESSYRSGTKLRGLIYLHRIIDPRMQGSALRNFRMFRKLCGEDCVSNILLATTFWKHVTEFEGKRREDELRGNREFWGEMLQKGSTIVRLPTDRDSSIQLLMNFANSKEITLQAQNEMVLQNKRLDDTEAAVYVGKEMRKIKEQHEAEIKAAKARADREVAARAAAQREEERRRQNELARRLEEDRRRIQREQREEEARYRREMAEEARREREYQNQIRREQEMEARRLREELERERRSYYQSFVCQRTPWDIVTCDNCGWRVHGTYYRKLFERFSSQASNLSNSQLIPIDCCFCLDTGFDRCVYCWAQGKSCLDSNHPRMQPRWLSS